MRFRPDGSVDGFSRYIPETAPGPALEPNGGARRSPKRARAATGASTLARTSCSRCRTSQRPNGRVDHNFVYERTDVVLGEAHIRLRLGVSGDALTEVTYFVHVPEAFGRRYEELRSANNTIARVATSAAGVLYGLGGCIIGVLWLHATALAVVEAGARRRRGRGRA